MALKTEYVMIIIPGFIGIWLDYLLPLCIGTDGFWVRNNYIVKNLMVIEGREN